MSNSCFKIMLKTKFFSHLVFFVVGFCLQEDFKKSNGLNSCICLLGVKKGQKEYRLLISRLL